MKNNQWPDVNATQIKASNIHYFACFVKNFAFHYVSCFDISLQIFMFRSFRSFQMAFQVAVQTS